MTGHTCDGNGCSFVTRTEDDHIVTADGEVLCMECYRKKASLEAFLGLCNIPEEPFKESMQKIDDLSEQIDKRMVGLQSMAMMGQLMANLLDEFRCEVEGDPKYDDMVHRARELVWRWEKEFKSHEKKDTANPQ